MSYIIIQHGGTENFDFVDALTNDQGTSLIKFKSEKEAENFSIDSVALWEGGDIYTSSESKEVTEKNSKKIKELD